MGTKKNILLAVNLFTISIVLQQCSCTKFRLDCAEVKYNFQLPVKAYPDKDSINIGDTIWLELKEVTSFLDTQIGQTIDYSGSVNLGSAIAFQIYDSVQKNWLDAVNNFKYELLKGEELRRTSLIVEYNFIEEFGHYVFKVAVIPEKKGLHRLLFSNSNNTYRQNDKCTKANFIINFKDTNHNRHLTGYVGPNVAGGDLNFYVK